MSPAPFRVVAIDHHDPAVAQRIHAVLVPAYAQEAALLQVKDFTPMRRTPQDIAAGREVYLGAWVGGALVGAIALEPDDEHEQILIGTLVVHPAQQRRGIARALLQAALKLAEEAVFAVSTGVRNAPALALYKSQGFVPYRRGSIGPEALPLVKLRRRPGAPARPQHIGIVACSAEGAALCYRTLCAEGAALFGAHGHPEVSMHTPSLADYVRCLDAGERQEGQDGQEGPEGPDWPGVAELMLASARKLARAGADFLVCPDNTIHQAFALVEPRSPRPWLHIADVVAAEAQARGFRRLGLLGTRWLVDSEVYPAPLAARGIACVRPDGATRDELHRIIMDELVPGRFTAASVVPFQRAVAALRADACDAVILGCTEIPLILNDGNAGLPTLDSTRLLARAALRRAAG
jgi:aspartate racemase